MSISVIKLFGKALTGKTVNFSQLNKKAVLAGYIIHPDCCTWEVEQFIQEQKINYNSTFYKSWNDIISKSRFELHIDQIEHYASTYGTGFEGAPFILNDREEAIPFFNFKVITPITKEEVNERCCNMLYSGIALSEETLKMILELVTNINVEKVKNKEALMSLHKKFNTVPQDNVEFVRYLVYTATAKTLLIKDKSTLAALKGAKINLNSLIEKYDINKLSEVFFRFKPIFLTLKKGNEIIVNKLRRLAEKNHKPMKMGFFEAVLSNPDLISKLPEKLKECSNFKKITLLQTILIRQEQLDMRFFGIRNGKLWAKSEKVNNKNHYSVMYSLIYNSLIESLQKKATSVKLPKGVQLTLPTSEKSFIGNFPLGTSFDLSHGDAIVGVNWRNSDGAYDLDLSLIDISGKKFGWNSHYKSENNSVIYSGDMTSADPEATELFYTRKGFNPSIVKINMHNGNTGAKFKLFLAKEKIKFLERNYMVNPNNVLFTIDSQMDSKEKMLGVLTGQQFILAQFKTGNKIVSGDSITNKYTDYALRTLNCYLSMEEVLRDAEFQINTGNEEIDLTNLSKDTLISLFS